MGVDAGVAVPPGMVVGTLDKLIGWGRSNSLWPAAFGLACCAMEMFHAGGPKFDIARFGAELFRPSPRQSDVMIVSGRVSQKMAPVVRQIYDQMLEPKWVIAMGACASSAGMFNNYALIQGVDTIIPVDLYVPGCPPTPDALLHGLIQLQRLVKLDPHHRAAQGLHHGTVPGPTLHGAGTR